MVTFTHMGYSQAMYKGKLQDHIMKDIMNQITEKVIPEIMFYFQLLKKKENLLFFSIFIVI